MFLPTFVSGPPLPSLHRLPLGQRSGPQFCRASAAVEAAPGVAAVSLDNEREGGSVIQISGQDKPFLLRQLNELVAEAGFSPQRINLLELSEDDAATAEYILDSTISEDDIAALRAKAESVWASADPHPPVVEKDGATLVEYNVPDKRPLPEEVVEQGMWFDVDPYAHRDWTTLTCIVPTGSDSHLKMMKAMADQKINIIFATIRSVAPCDAGYVTDVYLLQTMAGEPLAEGERIILHNAFVDVFV